jgi:hypothetical protein
MEAVAVARKTLLVCDSCGKEIPKASGATLRLVFADVRRAPKEADYCDSCASNLSGTRIVRAETPHSDRGGPAAKVANASQVKAGKKRRQKRKAKDRDRPAAGVGVISIRSGHHRRAGDSKAASRSHRAFRGKKHEKNTDPPPSFLPPGAIKIPSKLLDDPKET